MQWLLHGLHNQLLDTSEPNSLAFALQLHVLLVDAGLWGLIIIRTGLFFKLNRIYGEFHESTAIWASLKRFGVLEVSHLR